MRDVTEHYTELRKEFASRLKGGIAILFGGTSETRSHDTHHPFRQSSDLKYLTGSDEPESILVIKDHLDSFESILFVRPKNELMELWEGKRLGPEKAKELFAMDQCFSIDQFQEKLPELIKGHQILIADMFHPRTIKDIMPAISSGLNARRQKNHIPREFIHSNKIIGPMRLIKTDQELEFMRRSAQMASVGHKAAMAFCKPGRTEADVEEFMEFVFRMNGAHATAYESIVATGANACVLHYVENNAPIKSDELMLIDAGAEFHCFASDITRTFPTSGTFTGVQKDLYQLVLNSQKDAIAMAKPGNTLGMIHQRATQTLAEGLNYLKISDKSATELIETGDIKKYYPHGTGHWLGLDVHDTCPYLDDDLEEIKLAPGMVFTVEPGLYFQNYQHEIDQKFRGIGIRIEDDILITEKGHENLTSTVPREIKEVEEACKEDYNSFLHFS